MSYADRLSIDQIVRYTDRDGAQHDAVIIDTRQDEYLVEYVAGPLHNLTRWATSDDIDIPR